jgi:hypothetical protein
MLCCTYRDDSRSYISQIVINDLIKINQTSWYIMRNHIAIS